MKKIILAGLSIFLILLVVALLATGFWLIRPETHRPGLERALSDALQAQASIGRIQWIWAKQSPGLELQSVRLAVPTTADDASPARTVQPSEPSAPQNAFSARSIRLILDLSALIQKEFKVSSVRLEQPKVDLTRRTEGLTAAGVPLPPRGAPQLSAWGRFSWNIADVQAERGSLRYRDLTGAMPRTLDLESVDFRTKPTRPPGGLEFEGRAGFLAAKPNARFGGSYRKEPKGGWTAALTHLSVGLEKIPVRKLEQVFPELVPLGLRGQFVGAVSGTIDTLRHDGKRLLDLVGSVRLEGVKIFIRAFKSPIQDLNADIHYDHDTVVVSSVDGKIAGGEFRGKAEVKNLNKPDPDANFEFRVDRIQLSNLLPRPSDGRPQLAGRASFQIGGKVQGRRSQEWMASLQAKGSVALADGALTDVNVLRLIFDKLAVSLPGAREAFASSMPPDLGQKLAGPDTFLAPVEIPFFIGNGGVVYPNFRIVGDGFEIAGSGQQGFGGDIEFRAMLILDAAVSSYLLYACPDTSAIADSYGRLSLPVRLTGTIRNVRIIPDTQYVIQRVVSMKGSGYLMKALQAKQ